jgi:hypothetical protein
MPKKLLAALLICGCTQSSTKEGTQASDRGIARVSSSEVTRVLLTSESNRVRTDEVLMGTGPGDFHWVLITVPSSHADELYSDAGLSVDMRDSDVNTSFEQVYRETCNPAKEDFSPCWIRERYSSGEAGLVGTLNLRLSESEAIASYEVSWDGVTDRFGDPAQQYSHTTSAQVAAKIVAEAQ